MKFIVYDRSVIRNIYPEKNWGLIEIGTAISNRHIPHNTNSFLQGKLTLNFSKETKLSDEDPTGFWDFYNIYDRENDDSIDILNFYQKMIECDTKVVFLCCSEDQFRSRTIAAALTKIAGDDNSEFFSSDYPPIMIIYDNYITICDLI